jgi:splicing factor 3A subunit 3
MDGVIELQRRTHEDVNRLEMAAAAILAQEEGRLTQRERISRELTVAAILRQMSSSSLHLLHIYKDEDRARSIDIQNIKVEEGASNFGSFYVHLKDLKDNYRRSPFDRPIDDVEFEALVSSCRPTEECEFILKNFGHLYSFQSGA